MDVYARIHTQIVMEDIYCVLLGGKNDQCDESGAQVMEVRKWLGRRAATKTKDESMEGRKCFE